MTKAQRAYINRRSDQKDSVTYCWQHRIPFKASNLEGMQGTHYSTGIMPKDWADTYRAEGDNIVFTVVSYDTPIAWVLADGTEVKPPVKYSVTTSKQQGRLWSPAAEDN